jgi:CubicO group peptidase (beta-lactamase class C family)
MNRRISKLHFVNTLLLFLGSIAFQFLPLQMFGQVSKQQAKKIDELIKSYADIKQFNGNALVVKDGKVIFSKSYGLADQEWRIENSRSTKFRIGSITKTFTAMLIMQLMEKGLLSLEDHIDKYLPWYEKETASRITIRNLLSHTSGLTNYTARPDFYKEIALLSMPPKAFAEKYCQYKTLLFEPGTKFNYCNTDYYLLGLIIESVSGKSYAEVLKQNILDKTNMHNTGIDSIVAVIPKRAKGYNYGYQGFTNSYPINMATSIYAAGAMYSTVDDLALWGKAWQGTELLSQESKRIFFTPVINNHAFGLFINKMKDGKTAMGHPGGINGFYSFIIQFKEDNICIVLLTNQTLGVGDLDNCSTGIYSIVMNQQYKLPKKPVDVVLTEAYFKNGVQQMFLQYQKIKNDSTYNLTKSKSFLNDFGYALLTDGRVKESLTVLKLASEEFPNDANTLDSYAEALKTDGQYAQSIDYYKRILILNPSNKSAQDAIKELQGKLK